MLPWIYLSVLGIYILVITQRPSILIRPSVFVTMAMIVAINIAASFVERTHFNEFTDLSTLRIATILFPIPILIWVAVSPFLTTHASQIYSRCRNIPLWQEDRTASSAITLLSLCSVVIVLSYLATVPLLKTGLMTIFMEPENSYMAREASMKAQGPTLVNYAYSMFRSTFAPTLAILTVLNMNKRRPVRLTLQTVGLFALLFAVALEGSRLPVGIVLFAVGVGFLLRMPFIKGVSVAMCAFTALLLVAVTLSMLRERSFVSTESMTVERYVPSIAERVFVVPFETGARTLGYVEGTGGYGIQYIRPLAVLGDRNFVNLPLAVYQRHYPHMSDTGSINTAFLFNLQAAFGLWGGWLIALPLLMALDFVMIAFKIARGKLLVAFYATFLVSVLYLISSAYTTALITGGILTTVVLMYFTTQFARFRLIQRSHATPVLNSPPQIET